MSRFKLIKDVGMGLLTTRRAVVASLVVAGLYMFGGPAVSYLSTATRLVSEGVHEKLPVEFEIERAKTMMNGLLPEIKKNMITIAREEVGVKSLQEEVDRDQSVLAKREADIVQLAELLKNTDSSRKFVLVNDREVDREYANEQLGRIFERFKWDQDTLTQRMRLLDSQTDSLFAARSALEKKMDAKRDLEVELENLEARLYTVQRESVTSTVNFDESKFSRCRDLVQSLRARLDVAEQLAATGNPIEFVSSGDMFRETDILTEIDEFFSAKLPERTYVNVKR